jgi:hypothetical protein
MEINKIEDILKDTTLKDMKVLQAVAKGCGMKIALSEFVEQNNIPRLHRFTLVNWDFDKQNTEWDIVVN